METETWIQPLFSVETKALGPWHKRNQLFTVEAVREMLPILGPLDKITIFDPQSFPRGADLGPDQFERHLACIGQCEGLSAENNYQRNTSR